VDVEALEARVAKLELLLSQQQTACNNNRVYLEKLQQLETSLNSFQQSVVDVVNSVKELISSTSTSQSDAGKIK
jgi:uncharacterized coiled-coil DUF342 family protein